VGGIEWPGSVRPTIPGRRPGLPRSEQGRQRRAQDMLVSLRTMIRGVGGTQRQERGHHQDRLPGPRTAWVTTRSGARRPAARTVGMDRPIKAASAREARHPSSRVAGLSVGAAPGVTASRPSAQQRPRTSQECHPGWLLPTVQLGETSLPVPIDELGQPSPRARHQLDVPYRGSESVPRGTFISSTTRPDCTQRSVSQVRRGAEARLTTPQASTRHRTARPQTPTSSVGNPTET
jgi:hypothetical protein